MYIFVKVPTLWRKQISDFSTPWTPENQIVLPLTTFYVVLIRKHCSENVSLNIFCWFIIVINAGKLNCKSYSITDLVLQEHTSQIQDFFSTSVQFQDFSGTEKSKTQISGLFRTRGNPVCLVGLSSFTSEMSSGRPIRVAKGQSSYMCFVIFLGVGLTVFHCLSNQCQRSNRLNRSSFFVCISNETELHDTRHSFTSIQLSQFNVPYSKSQSDA